MVFSFTGPFKTNFNRVVKENDVNWALVQLGKLNEIRTLGDTQVTSIDYDVISFS